MTQAQTGGARMPYANPGDANRVIESLLTERARAIETEIDTDVLTIIAPMAYGLESFMRDALESIAVRRERLAVILETQGGYIEVVDRIVHTLRHHYPHHVEFVIPDMAMSAGTVLAMSGDAIWMDYFSVLGPIDPQVKSKSGGFIPAKGYLAEYAALLTSARIVTR